MTFAQQIREERNRLNLSQAEAARLLEVSKSTLEKWEQGQTEPILITQEGALARMNKAKPNN